MAETGNTSAQRPQEGADAVQEPNEPNGSEDAQAQLKRLVEEAAEDRRKAAEARKEAEEDRRKAAMTRRDVEELKRQAVEDRRKAEEERKTASEGKKRPLEDASDDGTTAKAARPTTKNDDKLIKYIEKYIAEKVRADIQANIDADGEEYIFEKSPDSSDSEEATSSKKVSYPKSPGAPKYAKSAFFHWLLENRETITKSGMTPSAVVKAAGIEWRALCDKSKWEKMAADDQKRYETEFEAYKVDNANRYLAQYDSD